MPTAEAVIAWQNIERRALDLRAADVEGTHPDGEGAYSRTHLSDGESACQDAQPNARGGGRGGWAVNPVLLVPRDPGLGAPSGPAELPGFGLLDTNGAA